VRRIFFRKIGVDLGASCLVFSVDTYSSSSSGAGGTATNEITRRFVCIFFCVQRTDPRPLRTFIHAHLSLTTRRGHDRPTTTLRHPATTTRRQQQLARPSSFGWWCHCSAPPATTFLPIFRVITSRPSRRILVAVIADDHRH
jgi:hypothetical protein